MRFLATFAALALVGVATGRGSRAAAQDVRGPPQGSATLASYISDDDYPAEAIRRGEEGTVGFVLDVEANGLVSNCEVTSSSGSEILDATTCSLMRARARFRPAVDQHGNPTSDRISARVRWVLPTEPVPETPGQVDLSTYISRHDYPAEAIRRHEQGGVDVVLTVSVAGRVVGCRVTKSSGSTALDARSCEIVLARVRLPAARDQTGEATPSIVHARIQWTLPPR